MYLPFNNLSQEELDKLDKIIAIESVKERATVYSCTCGFVYIIGNCGLAMQIGICPKCKKKIGGEDHKSIN